MSEPLVLGIESSCDETSVGIVRGEQLLANEVASSMELHARFGGVVPEVASRAHLEAIGPALRRAVAAADVDLSELDAVAVTAGPGLMGSLVVGLAAAKTLAAVLGKPLYGLNHLVGHVAVDLLDHPAGEPARPLARPTLALLVSGGHTQLLRVGNITGDVVEIGTTIDDAAGEAYDKVARLLGLNYPGGPAIDRAAAEGNRNAFVFPRGLSNRKFMGTAENPGEHRYDFSFSGLKTAVARVIESFEAAGEEVPVADIAASFQEAVVDVITKKAMLACRERGMKTLLLGGGVAANSRLRELLAARCASEGVRLIIPKFTLCTDNGAMVAALGARLVAAGREPSGVDFTTDSSLPVTTVCF